MYIPAKVDYAVRALVDLAQHAGEAPVRSADIARRKLIPEPYLERILHTLHKGGLVRSYRGPTGGHVLALEPVYITLGTVMRCLGAAESPIACIDDAAVCTHSPSCAQLEVWRTVDEVIYRILDATTIADLVERARDGVACADRVARQPA